MIVNEIFESFQGEGKSLGRPATFLRLTGCNLACIWCDTPYTWNWRGTPFRHPDKHDKRSESHPISVKEVHERLLLCKHKTLVITGGEPLLQQNEIIELAGMLKEKGWWIEIETNGTIPPYDRLMTLVDQINCSPKLANSGPNNHKYKRIVPSALKKLSDSWKTNFKFVIRNPDDMPEVLELVEKYALGPIYLMPEGKTKLDQEALQEKVVSICQEYGFNFSPRLHILLYDDKRGV